MALLKPFAMKSANILLAIFSIFIQIVLADSNADCKVAPLVIPIQNNTLDDRVALNRGVPLSVGGQTEGCRITFTRHQLGFRDLTDCTTDDKPGASVNESICIGMSGGVFDTKSPDSTWTNAPDGMWLVTVEDPPPEDGAHTHRGYADVFIAGKKLPQVPVETWSYVNDTVRSVLGLAPNNTVMQALANGSYISGETAEIGLCYGSRSQNKPSDGNIVFGGYDAGCVQNARNAEFVEYDLYDVDKSDPCPLQVRMKEVVLTYKNGSKFSVIGDSDGTVGACVDPIQNAFTFSPDMYARWAELTHHPDPNVPPADGSPAYTDQTYPLSAAEFMDTLTVELEGGYTVTIPNYELVSQERGANSEGAYDVTNSSRLMAAVSSVNELAMPVLGGVFLSQTYLRADYARGKFMLAHADTKAGRKEDVAATCSGGGGSSGKSSKKNNKGGLGPGAISGIVIGTVVGLAVIIGVIFKFWDVKRKRERETTAPASKEPIATVYETRGFDPLESGPLH